MDYKLKIGLTTALILFLFLCRPWQDAGAFRQETPPAITPQPGPPPQSIQDSFFYKWPGAKIISAFRERGLEVVNLQKGLTMGSSAAEETTIFLIPSAGDNIGGFVSSYRTQKALDEDRKYYAGMNNPSAPPAWRIFQRANILVLISGKVSEKKAMPYKNVLEGM